MTDHEPDEPVDRSKNQPGVLCTRCDHLNYRGQESCESCGYELYTDCPKCGARNPRVYTRCTECRATLRRGFFRRRRRSQHPSRPLGFTPLQLAILGVVGLLLLAAVLYFALGS